MWESYLPNAQIIGIENLSDIVQEGTKRTKILIGDAADERFLNDAVRRFYGGKIDIVIDDASHILDQQVRTFEALFPFVEEGGLYFVEDVSGSRFKDGNRGLLPFLDYSWNLAQQTTFFADANTSTYHSVSDIRSLSRSEREQIRVSFWNRNLGSVHYFHNLCVFEKLHRRLEIEDLKQTDRLRPTPGISYQLTRLGSRSETFDIDALEVDNLRLQFESIVEFIADNRDDLESVRLVSLKSEPGENNEAEGGKEKWLIDRTRGFAGQLNLFINEFKTRKHSMQRIEKLANERESECVRILHEFAVLQSTNAALSAEVARLKNQVEAARGKLQSVWDFIFRLQAQHVAESAQLNAELATLSHRIPEHQAALEELKRQNNALRLQNADWKHLVSLQIARLLSLTVQHLRRLLQFGRD